MATWLLISLHILQSVAQTPTPPPDPRCLPPDGSIWLAETTGDGDPTCGFRYVFVEDNHPSNTPQQNWEVVICESPNSPDAHIICGPCYLGTCPPTPPTPGPTVPTLPTQTPTPPTQTPTLPTVVPTAVPTPPTSPTGSTAPTTPTAAPTPPTARPTAPSPPSPPPTAPTPPLPPPNCSYYDLDLPPIVANSSCRASSPFSTPPASTLPGCPGCASHGPLQAGAGSRYRMVSFVVAVEAYDNESVPVRELPNGETASISIPLQNHATLENITTFGTTPSRCQTLVSNSLTCAWFDSAAQIWSTDGCTLSRSSSPSSTVGVCNCTRLESFALILETELNNRRGTFCATEIEAQGWVFIIVFLVLLVLCLIQTLRLACGAGGKCCDNALSLHVSLCVVCVLHVLSVGLRPYVIPPWTFLLAAVAQTLQMGQYGLGCVVWGSVQVFSLEPDAFQAGARGVVFAILVALFALASIVTPLVMVGVSDFDGRWDAAATGALIMLIVLVLLVLGVLVCGVGLLCSYGDLDIGGRTRPRGFVCLALVIGAVLLLQSVAWYLLTTELGIEEYLVWDMLYRVGGVCGVVLVLASFVPFVGERVGGEEKDYQTMDGAYN